MVAAGATHTMEREVYESESHTAFSFSTPYLYEGLHFAGECHSKKREAFSIETEHFTNLCFALWQLKQYQATPAMLHVSKEASTSQEIVLNSKYAPSKGLLIMQ